MIFWDSSAVIHLLIDQGKHDQVRRQLERDRDMLVWWGSCAECAAALARLERSAELLTDHVQAALQLLSRYRERWIEVAPSEELLELAMRLPRSHDLRAGDSFQLAAAVIACRHRPGSTLFYTFDSRLLLAAKKEGFGAPA